MPTALAQQVGVLPHEWKNAPTIEGVTGRSVELCYLAFFALNFAHLARCAAAILAPDCQGVSPMQLAVKRSGQLGKRLREEAGLPRILKVDGQTRSWARWSCSASLRPSRQSYRIDPCRLNCVQLLTTTLGTAGDSISAK